MDGKLTHREKWFATMIKKYGSIEAVKEHQREAQKKSRENYKGTGGFGGRPELAKKMSDKALKARWGYVRTDKTDTEA